MAAPTVTTQAASSVLASSFVGNGNVTDLGADNYAVIARYRGFCYIVGTSGDPTAFDSTSASTHTATGAYTKSVTDLNASTGYRVRAYDLKYYYPPGTYEVGYGSTVQVTTGAAVAPTVTTQAATSITSSGFTGNGTIADRGGINPTARGICYLRGTSGTPTIADSVVSETGSFGIGAFTENVTGLSGGSYRVRAFATNSVGTSYGTTVAVVVPYALSFSDSITLSDAIAKNIRLPKSDSMTIVDTFSRAAAFQRSFADSVTVTDVISKLYQKNTADSVTLADVLSKVASYHRAFTDGLALADDINISRPGEYFLSFSETLSLVDAISKQIDLPMSDAMALADEISLASTFNRSLSDSLTLADSMAEPVIITLLTLTIQSRAVTVGQQQQITVMGLFSDGSVQDVTSYCQFISSRTDLATIDSAGLVTGVSTGLTVITATIAGVTTNYTLAILPVRSTVIPQNGIVAFADGKSYRNATYLSRRFEYRLNSIGAIKVLASKYPVLVDLVFPDIPYTISVVVVSKKPQRVKPFLSEALEVRINPSEEVSAVFLASSIGEFNV